MPANIIMINNTVSNKISICSYFLEDEKTISLLEYTHNPQDTQALPAFEIRGIDFKFSGHLAPGRLNNSFISDCPIAKFFARYARRMP
jgi:hypothetical protein